MLDEAAVRAGYRLITSATLGSTNQDALARARRGEAGDLWIRALAQTAGRGRTGRSWSSPPGNLYVSLLLRDPAEPQRSAELGFVAGLALARAVRQLVASDPPVCLKWPNDLLHRGAKLAGILVEGVHGGQGEFACAIGFGVNCTTHPGDLPYPATNLSEIAGYEVAAEDVLRRLSVEFMEARALWNRGQAFGRVREGWLRLSLPAGSPLVVQTSSRTEHGLFRTIDDRGRLVLDSGGHTITVEAADVFLTGQARPDGSREGA